MQNSKAPVHTCPGSMFKTLEQPDSSDTPYPSEQSASPRSMLGQWPARSDSCRPERPVSKMRLCSLRQTVQLMRMPVSTKNSCAGSHSDRCPKLDDTDYAEKLTAIIKENSIRNVTVARMEVPCCGGLEAAVKKALKDSGKLISWQVVTISISGKIL